MGAVYRALDTEADQEVALKVLDAAMASNPAMLERFRREARHASNLNHSNIVTLYEFGEVEGTYYLSMEFVDGIDLYEYVHRKGPLDPEEARQLIIQAIRALQHAHSRGIVHRDIKPSNFLLARKGNKPVLKLTDMGLAQEDNTQEFRLTRAGTTVGTLDYISPEQARDSSSADIRSDLYSLGATWYYLLAGKPPFPKGGLAERLFRILHENPPDVRKLNPRVSRANQAVLDRLLAKSPGARYPTPAALLEDVVALERTADTPLRAESFAEKKRGKASTERVPGPRGRGPRLRQRSEKSGSELVPAGKPQRGGLLIALIGVTSTITLLALVVALVIWRVPGSSLPPEPSDPGLARTPSGDTSKPPEVIPKPPDPGPSRIHPANPPGPPAGPGTTGTTQPPRGPRWQTLYKPSTPINLPALRSEIESRFPEGLLPAPVPDEVVRLRVARLPLGTPAERKARPPTYPSLSQACRALPPGKDALIEIHDNGPVFGPGAALPVGGPRRVTIRAAEGFHPLLIWDVQSDLRKRAGSEGNSEAPLCWLQGENCSLTLEGLEIGVKWPASSSEKACLVQVAGGNLTLHRCTISVAGQHPSGLVLAKLLDPGKKGGSTALEGKGPRLCIRRCYARGNSLVALNCQAKGAHILVEDSLVVGGMAPLLEVRVVSQEPTTVYAVRSSLVSTRNLLSLQGDVLSEPSPAFAWLGWDTLLTHPGHQPGGALVTVAEDLTLRNMSWRAYNCLYAGWGMLLQGKNSIPASDSDGWRRTWGRIEGDVVQRAPWPRILPADVSAEQSWTFRTDKEPLGFAASYDAEKTLGCDPEQLPPVRDQWARGTVEPFDAFPVDVLADSTPPDIPPPGGLDPKTRRPLYHGERLDLSRIDLGLYLKQVQKTHTLASRVVLHLMGEGGRPTSAVEVKGSSLILYFEPPAKGKEPLMLRPGGADVARARALIDVEGGDLEMIGGRFSLSEPGPPLLLRVQGGNLRLHHCYLSGPARPTLAHQGLVLFHGSGKTQPEQAHVATFHETVLSSGGDLVGLQGNGAQLAFANSLLASAGVGCRVTLPPGSDRELTTLRQGNLFHSLNVQLTWSKCTFAARHAVLFLDAPWSFGHLARKPILVRTRQCAFLNPFGRSVPAGLFLVKETELIGGLLVWQSEGDLYDRRLAYGLAIQGQEPTEESGPGGVVPSWVALWGSANVEQAINHTYLARASLGAMPWHLERLRLSTGHGADLKTLPLDGEW
jgi:serine/threonine protein kinase